MRFGLGRQPRKIRTLAWQVALASLLLGWAWIIVSDLLLYAGEAAAPRVVWISVAKGMAYVLATSLLIFLLINAFGAELASQIARRLVMHRLYRSLFDRNPDPVCMLDADGRCVEVNATLLERADVGADALLGRPGAEVLGLENPALLDAPLRNALAGQPQTFETRVNRPAAPLQYRRITLLPMFEDQRLAGVYCISQDISAERSAQRQLAVEQARYKALYEHSMDGIIILREDDGILSANPAACAMLQMTEIEIIRAGREGLTDGADPRLQRIIEERRRTGHSRGETVLRRRDGSSFPVEVSCARFFDEQGNELASVVVRDISERREAEERLRQSELRYRSLFEHSMDAILLTDPETGAILTANPAACEMFGLPVEEIRRRGRQGLVDLDDPRLAEMLAERAQSGRARGELRMRRADGSFFPAELSSSVYIDAKGRRLSSMIIRNLTAQRELLDRLERSEQQARRAAELQQRVLDALPAHVAMLNGKGVIEYVNAAWKTFGMDNAYAGTDFGVGRNYLLLCEQAGEDDPQAREIAAGLRAVLEGEQANFSLEYACHAPEENRWYRLVAAATGDGAIAMHINVTDRVAAEVGLRIAREAFENASDAILVCDGRFRVRDANPAAERLLGWPRDALLGEVPAFMQVPEQIRVVSRVLQSEGRWHGELLLPCPDKRLRNVQAGISCVREPGTGALRHVVCLNDLSELQEFEQRLEHLSYHDPLTGLPNREALREWFRQAEGREEPTLRRMAVVYLDLDNFKTVNEVYGHSVGDELLQEAAARLKRALSAHDYLVRLGADEFILLLAGADREAGIRERLQTIMRILETPFEFERRQYYTTASAGVCLFPAHGTDMEELLSKADVALAAAKRQGRGRIAFFEKPMNMAVQERLQIERELRTAVANGELRLHYQPCVRLGDGRIVGLEALVRWDSPQLGMVPPGKFIPVAEDSGIILDIGAWVLEAACRAIRDWRAAGLDSGTVAVNLSPVQFVHADVARLVRQLLEQYALPGAALRMEITEGILVVDPERTARVLGQLNELGVAVALDDFGTGYSSLAYLKQFPIQYLKLDRSFIDSMVDSSVDASIVHTVIGLAHQLGMQVIAEGVEDARHVEMLRDWGCELAQGYHFSRPLPGHEISELLAAAPSLPAEGAAGRG